MIQQVHEERNPFQITTPENLTAQTAIDLFVDVFTDFPKITAPGHVFLTGPRGVGKSMMFRYLQADCQCLLKNIETNSQDPCDFTQIPFVGFYIPIKNWSLVKTELKRLDDRHASEIFNEHLMVSRIAAEVFNSLATNESAVKTIDSNDLYAFYKFIVCPLLDCEKACKHYETTNTKEILAEIKQIMNSAYVKASQYTKRLAFESTLPIYDGPLYDYQDFLVPLLSGLYPIKGFPDSTIFLLIDDAHFLSDVQTRILNSWIATRTSGKVSLKVSSQYNYKNYYTVTGDTIDSPHDFTEIDMTSLYTTDSRVANYKNRINTIVQRRLDLFEIHSSPEDFFPVDKIQEENIEKIAQEYRKKFDEDLGRGHYRSDDAYRYSRPDFIKSLGGVSKSSSSYSYAGFEQLVHLSSGIVRYFLEPAYTMYSKAISDRKNKGDKILQIPPSIQSETMRKEAENFLFSELERYKKEGHPHAVPKEDLEKLSNLVEGLGGLFKQILLSDRSERRIFSIAISDHLTDDVENILNIGVDFGFFHRSTIGRKNRKSGGRTKLFILNRRLAPIWNLDPTGFAGYLFVKNSVLQEGILNPQSLLSRIERSGAVESVDDDIQLSLFDVSEDLGEDSLRL